MSDIIFHNIFQEHDSEEDTNQRKKKQDYDVSFFGIMLKKPVLDRDNYVFKQTGGQPGKETDQHTQYQNKECVGQIVGAPF